MIYLKLSFILMYRLNIPASQVEKMVMTRPSRKEPSGLILSFVLHTAHPPQMVWLRKLCSWALTGQLPAVCKVHM